MPEGSEHAYEEFHYMEKHMSEMITRIKEYREKLSMSQKQLAEKVGVRRETIVRLENGQYNPSLKLAMDISKEFGAAVEDVFVFIEDKPILMERISAVDCQQMSMSEYNANSNIQ